MKPSTELFDLIKTLSKSEKRFFKLSSTLQSGEKNYLRLFDAIDKQDTYDENEIKEMFKGEKFIKHLPSEKNHLYKLILKSLRGFHADSSISSILKQEIKNVEILYKKALYKECKKVLNRAKKIAADHEKFYYWFELISWEKQLIEEEYEQGLFTHDLDQLIEEELMVIEKLRNLAEYQMIYSRINYIFRSGAFNKNDDERKEVEKIANHHLIKGKNTALSIRATSICYYIQGLCAITNKDYENALLKFGLTKKRLDDNPTIKEDLPIRYVRTMKNMIFANISLGNLDAAQELIDETKNLAGKKGYDTLDVQVKIFTFTANTQLMVLDRQGRFKECLPTIDEMIKSLDTMGNQLSKEQRVLFYFNIMYVYFGLERYKDALKWVNKILNDNENTLRQDIYNFSRIFNLVIHYQLGNFDLLEYIIKSTDRQLKKIAKDYKSEELFIRFLKKVIKLDSRQKRIELFKEVRVEFEAIMNNPNEMIVLEYFNVLAWVEAEIEGISYSEAVRKISEKRG